MRILIDLHRSEVWHGTTLQPAELFDPHPGMVNFSAFQWFPRDQILYDPCHGTNPALVCAEAKFLFDIVASVVI